MSTPSPDITAPAKDTGDVGAKGGAGPDPAPAAPPVDGAIGTSAPIVDAPSIQSAAADAASAIESLDAQLAELTAELLDPLTTPPAKARVVSEPLAPAPAIPAAAPAPVDIPAILASPKPVAAAAAPIIAPPPAAIAPMPGPKTTPTPAPAVPRPSPAKDAAVEPAAPGALLAYISKLSAPLNGKPPTVRTAAGLLAINSLLLALGVWGFVMFRPTPPPAEQRGFDFANASLPVPPPEKEAEKPAPEEGASAPHGEGHEGDAHGGAAKKAKPKAPPKAPPKKDKKGGAKKPAPDEHAEHE